MKLSIYTSGDKPFTKTIELVNGRLKKSVPQPLYKGRYRVVETANDLSGLPTLLAGLTPFECLGIGIAKGGITEAELTTKGNEANGAISRTPEFLEFADGPGLWPMDCDSGDSLEDFNTKMTDAIQDWPLLAKVSTASTSSNIRCVDGSVPQGVGVGHHTWIGVTDLADTDRASWVLERQLWLKGHGYILVSKSGAALPRTIMDPAPLRVNQPIFENGAILGAGLVQELPAIVLYGGGMVLHTATALPDLTPAEMAAYDRLVDAAKLEAAPECAAKRAKWLAERTTDATAGTAHPHPTSGARPTLDKATKQRAKVILGRALNAERPELTAEFPIYLADGRVLTVAAILGDPEQFDGALTLDPLEPDYYDGKQVGEIRFRDNGQVTLYSHAHGGQRYLLMFDAESYTKHLKDNGAPANWNDQVALQMHLDPAELTHVVDALVGAKVGRKTDIRKQVKEREEAETKDRRAAAVQQTVGNRTTLMNNFGIDMAEHVAMVETILTADTQAPLVLNNGGAVSFVTHREPPHSHAAGDPDGAPPEVPALAFHDRTSIKFRIERSIAYMKSDGQKVSRSPVPETAITDILASPKPGFPSVTGLVVHPIISECGETLATEGYHQQTKLVLDFGGARFDPVPENPTDDQVAAAIALIEREAFAGFEFASDLDRAAALAGLFCVLQRRLMPLAPAFAITARRQGTGKTTLARILHILATGRDVPVTALPRGQEGDKAMLAHLSGSPAMLTYDNLRNGAMVESDVLTQVITASHFTGRILGISKDATVPTNTLHVLTGNNIGFSADLNRRILECQLKAEADEPARRKFDRPDVLRHMLEVRRAVVPAALTIIKATVLANIGRNEAIDSAGFPQWGQFVVEPVKRVGYGDVLEVFSRNVDRSPEANAKAVVITSIETLIGADVWFESGWAHRYLAQVTFDQEASGGRFSTMVDKRTRELTGKPGGKAKRPKMMDYIKDGPTVSAQERQTDVEDARDRLREAVDFLMPGSASAARPNALGRCFAGLNDARHDGRVFQQSSVQKGVRRYRVSKLVENAL
jgi:hypothetical protein